jgi:hypothetical protein
MRLTLTAAPLTAPRPNRSTPLQEPHIVVTLRAVVLLRKMKMLCLPRQEQ